MNRQTDRQRVAILIKCIRGDLALIERDIDLLDEDEDVGDIKDELEMAFRHLDTAWNYAENALIERDESNEAIPANGI